MNVVHVVPSVSKESSGPSYSVLRLCDALIEAGASLQLLTLEWFKIDNPPSYLKSFPIGMGPRKLARSPQLKRYLNTHLFTENTDIIHNHGMWQMNAIYPAVASHKKGITYISSPRGSLSEWAMDSGSFVKPFFWRIFQQKALKRATLFHATAKSEFSDIRRMSFKQPVAIVPNGIDIPEEYPQRAKEVRRILFLARIHPIKGLDILLPAWKNIQELFPDWELVIAGDDNSYHGKTGYLDKMKSFSNELGLQRVQFIGEVTGKVKEEAFCAADLFVLPSYSENFGIAVAEALSYGVPVITTSGTPWNDLVDKNAGWYINAEVESLTQCLKEALEMDSGNLKKMGECGKQWMAKEYSWKSIGQKMYDTYKWLKSGKTETPEWVMG